MRGSSGRPERRPGESWATNARLWQLSGGTLFTNSWCGFRFLSGGKLMGATLVEGTAALSPLPFSGGPFVLISRSCSKIVSRPWKRSSWIEWPGLCMKAPPEVVASSDCLFLLFLLEDSVVVAVIGPQQLLHLRCVVIWEFQGFWRRLMTSWEASICCFGNCFRKYLPRKRSNFW